MLEGPSSLHQSLNPKKKKKKSWKTYQHYIVIGVCVCIIVGIGIGIYVHTSSTQTITTHPSRPHILMIMSDDLGWNDVSWNNYVGNNDGSSNVIYTPNLDALRSGGQAIPNNYVQSVCSPTRAALLTGLYPSHTGIGPQVIKPCKPYGISDEIDTWPEIMKSKYNTYMVGKWHLGYCDKKYTPLGLQFEKWTGA